MKHPSVRELFDYWNERRGTRLAPERVDIEPGAIRRVLADTFILSCEPRHPFRIAGTRVCALFARELKGTGFLDLWSAASRHDLRTLLAIATDETVGVVASAVATGPAAAKLQLELLLLPLSQRGPGTARLLGALAPSAPQPWLGTHVLSALTLGTHRYVGPAVAAKVTAKVTAKVPAKAPAAIAPRPAEPPQPRERLQPVERLRLVERPPQPRQIGRLRHGFVVYDGGQS
jgi:hypothetical protein